MVPSGSGQVRSTPPENSQRWQPPFYRRATTEVLHCAYSARPSEGYPAGQYRAPRDASQTIFPVTLSLSHSGIARIFIHLLQAARAAAGPTSAWLCPARRDLPAPIALNDTRSSVRFTRSAVLGESARAQDLERNSGILSEAVRIARSISSSTSFIYFT